MAIRKIPLVDGEYYHLYNRGNSKQKIFLDKEDYLHFIKCLFVCNTNKKFKFRDNIVEPKIDAFDFDKGESLVSIGAWVLMSNHFHLYLTNSHQSDRWESLGLDKNRISEFMRKLLTAYTLYFNKKYKRTGSLFEGKFKSVHISDDVQAKYLFSYIHLNPIKIIDSNWKEKEIKNINNYLNFLIEYKWSSYLDYKGIVRTENKILNLGDFPQYFSRIIDFDEEISTWFKK